MTSKNLQPNPKSLNRALFKKPGWPVSTKQKFAGLSVCLQGFTTHFMHPKYGKPAMSGFGKLMLLLFFMQATPAMIRAASFSAVTYSSYVTGSNSINGSFTVPSVSGLTFSQINAHSCGSTTATAGSVNGTGWNATSAAASITADKMYTWTITADSCTAFTISAVSILSQASGTGAKNMQVDYAIGTGSFGSAIITGTLTASSAAYAASGLSISIPAGSYITFRMTGWNGSAAGGTMRFTQGSSFTGTTTALSPSLTLGSTSINFGSLQRGTSATTTSFTVSGSGIGKKLKITPPAGFKIGTSAGALSSNNIFLTPSGNNISSTTIYVGYSPATTVVSSGNITFTSCPTISQTVALAGKGADLTTNTTSFTNAFGNVAVGGNSTTQSFTVTGTNLANSIIITPPSGFRVRTGVGTFQATSLTINPTSGVATTIDVQFWPAVATAYSGNIDISSTGISPNITIPVSGNGINASGLADPTSVTATAINQHRIDLGWALNASSDSVMVTYNTNNSFSVPVKGKTYHINDTLSAGDTIIYIGTALSFSHTSLQPLTQYYYKIFSDSAVTYSGGILVHDSTYFVKNSSSDIISQSGFSYPTNIDYTAYQSASGLSTSNTAQVFGLTVRDAGASGNDRDTFGTTLTAISFTVTNSTFLRAAALFDNTGTKLAETTVSGSTISFSGFSYATTDNGTADFTIGVTFKTTITDNSQLTFTVASVTAATSGSGFLTGNGGAATSSTTGTNNKIVVTASKIAFVQVPGNVTVNTSMNPAVTIKGLDVNNNLDLDYNGSITATVLQNSFGTGAGTSATASAGMATFSTLKFSGTGPFYLSFSDGTLPAITSDTLYVISGTAIYTNSGVTNTSSATQPGSAITVASGLSATQLAVWNGAVAPAFTGTGACNTVFNWDPKDALVSGSTSTPLDTTKGVAEFTITPTLGHKVLVSGFSASLGSFHPGTGGADSTDLAYSTDNGAHWITGTTGTSNNGKVKITASASNCTTNTPVVFTLPTPVTCKGTVRFRIYSFHETVSGDEMSVGSISVSGAVYNIANTSVSATAFGGNFHNVVVNKHSFTDSFTVSGANLGANDIVITPPAGFEVEAVGGSFSASALHISPVSGSVANAKVYVRFSPTAGTTYSGNISVASSGVSPDLSVAVSGNGTTNTIDDPTSFTASSLSYSQLSLGWTQDANADNVIIARNTVNTFGTPVTTTVYSAGDPLTGGGTIVYAGGDLAFTDTGLTASTKYYYQIWSDSSQHFSPGIGTNSTTQLLNAALYINSALQVSNSVSSNSHLTTTDIVLINNNTAGTDNSTTCTFHNATGFSGSSFSATADNAFQFSITPNTGYQVKITSLHTSMMSFNPGTGGANKMRIAYSTDNGNSWVNNGADIAINNTSFCQEVYNTAQTWTLASPIVSKSKILFRIYAWGETNSADATNTAYDTVYGQITQIPTITLDTTNLKAYFGDVIKNTTGATHTFHFSAVGLKSAVTITSNSHFKIRTGANPFGTSATVAKDAFGNITNAAIDVQFDPTSVAYDSNYIVLKASSADSQYIKIKARGVANNLAEPTPISIKALSNSQIQITWHPDANADSVMIVKSTAGSTNFAVPVEAKSYAVGDTLGAQGDTVEYIGNAATFTQNYLNTNANYYFRVFTDSSSNYSFGTSVSDSTFRNTGISSDYFRSIVTTGAYGGSGNWQTSQDSVFWVNTTLVPTKTAKGITIEAGDSIYIDANPGAIDQVYVQAGGVLTLLPGTSLNFNNGTGTEMLIAGKFYDQGNLTIPALTSITVNAGGTLIVNGTGNALTTSGTFTNNGTVTVSSGDTFKISAGSITSTGVFNVNNGAVYTHNINAGVIPSATWADGAVLNITGVTSTAPSGFNQSFSNFIWNCSGQTAALSIGMGSGAAIRGNCSVLNTNGAGKALGFWASGAANSLLVGGDFTLGSTGQAVTQSQVYLNNASAVINSSLQINGNLINYGTFNFNFANTGSSMDVKVKGNIAGSSGNYISNAKAGQGTVTSNLIFTGVSTQTIPVTMPTTAAANPLNFEVGKNAVLSMANFALQGTGTFKLDSNATLISTNTNGLTITGALKMTGTKTVDTTANYILTNAGAAFNPGFSSINVSKLNNLTFNGTGTVALGGDLSVNNTLDAGTSVINLNAHKLTLNGTLATAITLKGGATSDLAIGGVLSTDLGTINFASGSQTLRNLSIDRHNGSNSGTMVLGSNLTVSNALTLTGGNIKLTDDTLKIGSSTLNGGSASSFVYLDQAHPAARLERTFTGSALFPIGDGYNPITIENNGTSTYDVGLIDRVTNQAGIDLVDSAVAHTWLVTPSANTQINVIPQWDEPADLAGPHFDNANAFVAVRIWNGGSFLKDWTPTQPDTQTVNISGSTYNITSGRFNAFAPSTYYIAIGTSGVSALPVTLMTFTAKKVDDYAKLYWKTASELNNKGFDIERSFDGKTWTTLGFIEGHGSTNVTNEYSFNDHSSDLAICTSPVIYYRLKQVDFNGIYVYSNIQAINCMQTPAEAFSCYPNPAENMIYFNWKNDGSASTTIIVTDISGREVANRTITGKNVDYIQDQMDISHLKPGSYIISLISGQTVYHSKIVKK